MQTWKSRTAARVIPVVALVLSAVAQFVPIAAHATFTSAYIRLDRMMISSTTTGLVCAKPLTVGTEAKVVLTFPTGFNVSTTAANWSTSTTTLPAGATAWPSIGATATSATGQVVTFASGDLTVATLYCFTWTNSAALTNPGSAAASEVGSIETQTAGSAVVDHSDIALATIANDQIVVSAVVPPTFIFTLSGNTDTFGSNLDPASIKTTTGRTVTVTTNAKGGWIAWAQDSQQGLRSASAAYTIPTPGTVDGTPSTLTAGTEGYVLDTRLTTDAAGGCTLAIAAEYAGNGTTTGGTFTGTFQPIASCTGTSPATANGDVITLQEHAAISGATPAGSDYSDTITVVGAGNF